MPYSGTIDTTQPQESVLMSEVAGKIRDFRRDIRERIEVVSPVGIIKELFDDTIPDGWLECDGSAISRTTYADLYSIIGERFGIGNGTTTFNIPDLRGQFIRGNGEVATRDLDAKRYKYINLNHLSANNPIALSAGDIADVQQGDYILNRVTKEHLFEPNSRIQYIDGLAMLLSPAPSGGYAGANPMKSLIVSRSVRGVFKNGVITSGSAIITGINDTSSIEVGEPILVKDFLGTETQEFATVQSVDSSSQVTASRNAISSGTYSLGEIFFVSNKLGSMQLFSNKKHRHSFVSQVFYGGAGPATRGSVTPYAGYVTAHAWSWEEYTQSTGGDELRPKNISAKFIIKSEGI